MEQSLKTVKLLGGIGMILGLLGWLSWTLPGWGERILFLFPELSFFGIFVALLFLLIGAILVSISLSELKKITGRKEIFRNYLIGVIFQALAIGMGGFLFFYEFQSMIVNDQVLEMPRYPLYILLFPAASLTFFPLGGYFIMKSFKTIAEVTKRRLYLISGCLFFLGGLIFPLAFVLVIFLDFILGVPDVGFLLDLRDFAYWEVETCYYSFLFYSIATIFAIVGFFSLPEKYEEVK